MTSMMEPMDVDSSFKDDIGEDEVDTHSDIFEDDENLSRLPTVVTPESRYGNKSGAFTTGIDVFSKVEQDKMRERAKRFGSTNYANSRKGMQEHDLYQSMGIDEDNEYFKFVRLNVLHMRGTENMSTKDVFDYFEIYAPASIEWINDVSCNIVWLDKISAARALLGLSKRIIGLSEKNADNSNKKSHENNSDDESNITNENCCIYTDDKLVEDDAEKSDNTINLSAIDFPLPPGIWRKGADCSKSKTILLRFATTSDKKQHNSEKLSDYYKKYGNPNFGGMKGILTDSRKRMYKQTRSNKQKQINMTDNVDNEKRTKNPWGALSETWGANDFVENDFSKRIRSNDNRNQPFFEKSNIKERLGSKYLKESMPIEESVSDESSDSDSEWNKRSKILRMRMHADDEEEKVQKKRLKQLTKKIQEKISGNDLRSRLGRPKPQLHPAEIQVVVTNRPERYRNSWQLVDENEVIDDVEEVVETLNAENEEKEEGEWEEEEDANDVKAVTVEDETYEEEAQEVNDQEEDEEESDSSSSSSSSSDISEKEVQGPQGSVIKVIPRAKPRVASTVWARLNQNAQKRAVSNYDRRDLRSTLKGDLRSRLGYHNRERSPLRIEVKNEKYAQINSESE